MAGLMSGGGQSRPRAAERNPMGMSAGADEESNVTPEEQAEYDQFVENGLAIMYDEKAMPELLSRLTASGDPVEGLANATAMLVMRLEDSARQQGRKIDGAVTLNGGIHLLEVLVELAEAAGVPEFTPDQIEQATLQAMDVYREARAADGSLPTEEIADDMEMLVAADQQGALDEVVPGASEYAQKVQGEMPDQPRGESRKGLMR